jgi:hypothetical protein
MPGMNRRYRYMTRNGHPPNQSVPPGVPRPASGPQYIPVFTQPPTNPPPTYMAPPGYPQPPPGYCWLPAPAPAPPPIYVAPPPPPYPPFPNAPPVYGGYPPTQQTASPAPIYGAVQPAPGVSGGKASTLRPGSRVRGQVPVFPDRNMGYIFAKKQCTFHLIESPIKPWKQPGCELTFTPMMVDCRMTIKEFIEQIGAKELKPSNPATGPGSWAPSFCWAIPTRGWRRAWPKLDGMRCVERRGRGSRCGWCSCLEGMTTPGPECWRWPLFLSFFLALDTDGRCGAYCGEWGLVWICSGLDVGTADLFCFHRRLRAWRRRGFEQFC